MWGVHSWTIPTVLDGRRGLLLELGVRPLSTRSLDELSIEMLAASPPDVLSGTADGLELADGQRQPTTGGTCA